MKLVKSVDRFRLYRDREGWVILKNGRRMSHAYGYINKSQMFAILMDYAVGRKRNPRIRFADVIVEVKNR